MLRNKKYRTLTSVAVVALVACSVPVNSRSHVLAASLPQSEAEIVVKSFRQTTAEFIASYKTDKREHIIGGPGKGWHKVKDEPGEYSIDVRRTDSLVTPYTGILQFSLTGYATVDHPTREEAERDTAFVKDLGRVTHEHTYAFQEGQWVIKQRRHRREGMAELGMDKWYDCEQWNGCF